MAAQAAQAAEELGLLGIVVNNQELQTLAAAAAAEMDTPIQEQVQQAVLVLLF